MIGNLYVLNCAVYESVLKFREKEVHKIVIQ